MRINANIFTFAPNTNKQIFLIMKNQITEDFLRSLNFSVTTSKVEENFKHTTFKKVYKDLTFEITLEFQNEKHTKTIYELGIGKYFQKINITNIQEIITLNTIFS